MNPNPLVVVFQSQVIPTLRPDRPQYPRLPCPSLSPRFSSDSCPMSLWCYLTILSFARHPSPFAFNLSQIKVFSSDLALHIRWPKYWSFSFSISVSNEYSGLISFRMNSFDLLVVQGTLKSLLQQHVKSTSPVSPASQDDSLPTEPLGKPHSHTLIYLYNLPGSHLCSE